MDTRGSGDNHDAELVVRARQHDAAAWEELVRAHQEPVFRLAYLLLHDADDAADVAQDVFVRAFRSLDRFDLARPLRPWLLTITTNLVHNRQRSIGRYLVALRRSIQLEQPIVAAQDEHSDAGWEAEILWQAIRRLRRSDQEVLYLRYFLELPEAELASTLHVPAGTVKSRLSRAMSRLRKVVDGEFPMLRMEREV